jgi:hypothetical protein
MNDAKQCPLCVDVVEKIGDLRFGALIVAVLASVIGTSDRTGRW